jgi:hypothetical protein
MPLHAVQWTPVRLPTEVPELPGQENVKVLGNLCAS